MKTIKSIFTSIMLIVLVSLSASAQTNTKVIAVVNEAEWCSACKNNGERAMKAFKENNKDAVFQFVMNNLTNDETKTISTAELEKHGLVDAMSEFKGTGVVYFFNADTKALISHIGISKSDEELASAMLSAQNGSKVSSSNESGCN